MIQEHTIGEWVELLSSKEPTPGGGGASALGGALGVSLGMMVANLTSGKKRYADVEEEVGRCLEELQVLQQELLGLADRDAEVFAPLAAAYRMPGETKEERERKEQATQALLSEAAHVPFEIMKKAAKSLEILDFLEQKGSRMAASDVGVAASFIRSALTGAVMNVWINTRSMTDREKADAINQKARTLLADGVARADRIYENVAGKLCQKTTG